MALPWLPNLIAATIVAGLALAVSLRRPPRPLWPVLLVYQLLLLLYLAGDTLTLISRGPAVEELGIFVLYTGSFPAAAVCWLLALRYADAQGVPFAWARGPWQWVPVGWAIAGWCVMATNPLHGQFLTPVIGEHNIHHWAWNAIVPFGYLLVTASVGLYVGIALRASDATVRRNALIMAGGIALTIALNVVSYGSPHQLPFDMTALGLGASSAVILFGAYRTRLFGLLPVALPQVLEHEPDGVILMECDGRWIYSNPAAEDMIAATPEASQRNVVDLLCARLRDASGGVVDSEILSGELLGDRCAVGCEIGAMQLPDGRWVDLTSTAIPDARGQTLAFALRLHDVSALHRLTEALEAAEARHQLEERLNKARRLESLGVLAAGIAHDFNNLLSVIVGNARLGLSELDSPASLRRRIERIESAGQFATELTDQILTTAGKHELRLEAVDLSQLVAAMLDLLKGSVSPKCEVEARLAAGLPEIEADATQLRQVVMNLVCNASDAMGSVGGRVVVRTALRPFTEADLASAAVGSSRESGSYVILEVSDDGVGFDDETRARIFEPFFTTRPHGRGLGLAAVHGIVQSHRAALLLESAPGEGACFQILFPPSTRIRAAGPLHSAAAPAEAASGRVLVVDDDPAVRELAEIYLDRAGLPAVSVANGEEALRVLERPAAGIDAVVLDLEMPELDGGVAYRELRRRWPGLAVVVVSGYGRELASERFGVEVEGDAFLSKPYSPEALVAAVRRCLQAARDVAG